MSSIPFITFKNSKFEINPDAANFLSSIKEKIGVISIVGKYRTGKSFFVNRVLLQGKGFQVGPTINPCTKGLWIWTETILANNPDFPDMKALVIDTEGFGGMDENVNHDTRIFLFSLLLSSFFIFNSVGSIDENALNSISLIVNLAKEIQCKQSDTSEFPSFLWVVRDFALRMVDNFNKAMNSKEYLEKALEMQKGVSDQIEQKNRIRRLIKHFFKERDCFTMVRPVEQEQELQSLNQMNDSDFRQEFQEQLKIIRTKIFKKLKPKQMQNQFLNGSMLLELANSYVQTMNSGKVPNIETAWVYICRAEGQKAMSECYEQITKQIDNLQEQIIEESDIEKIKKSMKDSLVNHFKKKSIGDEQEQQKYLEQIELKLDGEFKYFKEFNSRRLKQHYESLLQPKINELLDSMNQYDNFHQFQNELLKLKTSIQPNMIDYFDKACLPIYQSACETLEKKITQKKNIELQNLEQQKQDLNKQIKELKQDNQECSVRINSYTQNLDNYQNELNKKNSIINQNQQQIEKLKSEQIEYLNNSDKQLALINQEKTFLQKDILKLQDKIDQQQQELKRFKQENSQLQAQNEELNTQIKQIYHQKKQEIARLQSEFDEKVQELKEDNEAKKQLQKQQNEWVVEKNYLENQMNFYKNQVDENKKLHDALLMALQSGNQNNDQESNQELMETNRNLSTAVNKFEATCSTLEKKNEKLRKYKKMVKSCSSLKCIFCNKPISSLIFYQHLQNCEESSQNQQNQSSQSNQISVQNIIPVDPNELQVSINQTMVRETMDNKPFTEYILKLQYGSKKWTVSRRYKNFCELHQNLLNSIPGIQLPECSNAIINTQDMNAIFQMKRPLIIEDRRKALQQYLRELVKIDVVRNSRILKQFVELEEIQSSRGSFSSQDTQQSRYPLKETDNSQMKLLPQSPQSFLKCWNERQQYKMNGY